MKIYVIRHGQTDWNLIHKIQGVTDTELNDTGIKQAEEARENLKNIDFDLIICSPLKRTKKTAEIINQNRNIPIIYNEKLKERCFGNFEGRVVNEDDIFKSEVLYDVNVNYSEDKIESIKDLMLRIKIELDNIKEKYSDKKVLIVTHGGVLRAVNAYFNGIPESGILNSAEIKNCEIREYNY